MYTFFLFKVSKVLKGMCLQFCITNVVILLPCFLEFNFSYVHMYQLPMIKFTFTECIFIYFLKSVMNVYSILSLFNTFYLKQHKRPS